MRWNMDGNRLEINGNLKKIQGKSIGNQWKSERKLDWTLTRNLLKIRENVSKFL